MGLQLQLAEQNEKVAQLSHQNQQLNAEIDQLKKGIVQLQQEKQSLSDTFMESRIQFEKQLLLIRTQYETAQFQEQNKHEFQQIGIQDNNLLAKYHYQNEQNSRFVQTMQLTQKIHTE